MMLSLTALAVVGFGSCSSDSPENNPDDKGVQEIAAPLAPDAKMTGWLESHHETTDKFCEVWAANHTEDNHAFSPYSLHMALSMLANGAEGDAQRQLLDALCSSKEGLGDLNAYNRAMLENYPKLETTANLKVANAVWHDAGFNLLPSFTGTMQSDYDASVFNANYLPDDIKGQINRWVSDKTANRIKELIEESTQVNPPVTLVNAMCFDAEWDKCFDAAMTKSENFRNADGSLSEVSMMHNEAMAAWYETRNGRQIVTLPFANQRFKATFILPAETENVYGCLASEAKTGLTEYGQGELEYVEVALPVFDITSRLDCKETLNDMGVNKIFEPGHWGGMTDASVELFVDKILQQTNISINEKGGEGASATVVIFDVTAFEPGVSHVPEFTADRPFVMIISESACRVPLFVAVLDNMKN